MKEEDYGEKYKDHLLQQYKAYIDTVTATGTRRDQANRFYVLLLSGLLAVLSVLYERGIMSDQQNILLLAFGILGIVVCGIWFINISTYRKLSRSRFDILRDMEKQLPYSLYTQEWKLLKKRKYITGTKLEKCIPIIFAVPYVVLFIYAVWSFL